MKMKNANSLKDGLKEQEKNDDNFEKRIAKKEQENKSKGELENVKADFNLTPEQISKIQSKSCMLL